VATLACENAKIAMSGQTTKLSSATIALVEVNAAGPTITAPTNAHIRVTAKSLVRCAMHPVKFSADMPCAVPCNILPCSERCGETLSCSHRYAVKILLPLNIVKSALPKLLKASWWITSCKPRMVTSTSTKIPSLCRHVAIS